jgi:hypothetical protein
VGGDFYENRRKILRGFVGSADGRGRFRSRTEDISQTDQERRAV